MKKWVYNFFYSMYKKPRTLFFTYEFIGKGSKEALYEVEESQEFDLLMKLEFINTEDWDWPVMKRIKAAYSKQISKREKVLLVEARREKYISLENEERITGDYIVSVKCDLRVTWTKLSYEEYTTLKQLEKEPKSI